MKYAELKPGMLFFDDIHHPTKMITKYSQPVVVKEVKAKLGFGGEPIYVVYTECGKELQHNIFDEVKFNGDWKD